ncbi:MULTISPECIES: ATP-grasp domain-containing protein [unclassified Sedimentibacter]|uniref:ATP-grasp domain-containing protein n=1 Tax=unclassified Sedimentibacter TaxID=2649220 RepID=UPI0027E15ED6|nr:ATP-grasp domain-containing protein [Sedimentibacter sp. MB35-C1]WMJ78648.1 ATP-grasp domain-containing protein [Sedimentibacter sp. MB35-C1]
MNVLVEGIGSMVFNTQLKYYKEMDWNIIGIDIDNKSSGMYLVSKSYIVPKYSDVNCFEEIEKIIDNENIDLVFPSINEGLLEWSKRKKYFFDKYKTKIVISDEPSINICADKWNTYNFFYENNIRTPKTSLLLEYDLIKPRIGRGSAGIYYKDKIKDNFNMEGNISQELVTGQEYTIDILCDFNSNPVYIIPRKRIGVESGVSVKGVTVYDEEIIEYCKIIVERLKPIGIINIQCFKDGDNIYFIEINPRIAGGSSLSFAATENWFKALECFILGKTYTPKKVVYGRYMFRTFEDVIIDEDNLIKDRER